MKPRVRWCFVILLLLSGLFTSPASAQLLYEYEGELHARTWSLGGGFGTLEGLDDDLARISGLDRGVSVVEYTENHFFTPYVSNAFNASLNLMNNFSVVQVGFGRRWSTVPFPKTFLRPWAGLYATLDFLEDDRDLNEPLPPGEGEEEAFEGIGVGVAGVLGLTINLGGSLALEVAAKGDAMQIFGRLEEGELFSDGFYMRGVYVRLMFISK